MPIRIDVPGYGITEFEDEKQAEDYFKNEKNQRAADQGYTVPEYEELEKKSRDIYEQKRKVGTKGEKDIGDYAFDALKVLNPLLNKKVVRGVAEQPILRNFAKDATWGLTEPVSAGITTGIRKAMGDDESLADIYRDVTSDQKATSKKINEENPGQAALGSVLGFMAPGGLTDRAYKTVTGATQLPLMAAEKVPLMVKVAQRALQGGAAGLAAGAGNELSSELNLEDEKWHPVRDFLLGAAGDTIVGMPAEAAVSKLSHSPTVRYLVENYLPWVGKARRGARIESEEGANKAYQAALDEYKAAEAAKKSKIETDFENVKNNYRTSNDAKRSQIETDYENARQNYRTNEEMRRMQAEADATINQREAVRKFQDLIKEPEDVAAPVGRFQDILSKEDRKLSQSYEDMIGNLMRENANKEYDTSPIIDEVSGILDSLKVNNKAKSTASALERYLDEGASASEPPKQLNKIFSPEFKELTSILSNIKNSFGEGTTVKEIDLLRQQLGELAKFGKNPSDRGKLEKISGKLYDTSKEHLNQVFEDLMGPEGAERIAAYKKNFATKKPLIKGGQALAKLPAERQVVSLRSKLPASKAIPLVEEFPELKEPITEMFLSMLSQHSVAPRKFTKEINYYGRENLKKIMGDETFGALEATEKNLHEAAVPWKKKYKPGEAPKKEKFLPERPPQKAKYVPEAPPKLSEPQMEQLYQTLAEWARLPAKAKKKFGTNGIGAIFGPMMSQYFNSRESFDPINVTP